MVIKRLEIANIRNLQSIKFKPSKGFNIIEGCNGSGKTSLLEAIHLLSLGRSFRTSRIKNVINDSNRSCLLFAEIEAETRANSVFLDPSQTANSNKNWGQNNQLYKLGLQKYTNSKTVLRINGQNQKSFAGVANLTPVHVIAPEVLNVVDASPTVRRQLIDWGVFHVEHRFHETWRAIQKILKQRNTLLRQKARYEEITAWDHQLVTYTAEITKMREAYFSVVKPYIVDMLSNFGFAEKIQIGFFCGWKSELSFEETLLKNKASDFSKGHTTAGPHKADIRIELGGQLAKDICSRGQKKVLSSAIKLAQIKQIKAQEQKNTVVLVDDLASELDEVNRNTVIDILKDLELQVFLTCINKRDLSKTLNFVSSKLFHVSRGTLEEKEGAFA